MRGGESSDAGRDWKTAGWKPAVPGEATILGLAGVFAQHLETAQHGPFGGKAAQAHGGEGLPVEVQGAGEGQAEETGGDGAERAGGGQDEQRRFAAERGKSAPCTFRTHGKAFTARRDTVHGIAPEGVVGGDLAPRLTIPRAKILLAQGGQDGGGQMQFFRQDAAAGQVAGHHLCRGPGRQLLTHCRPAHPGAGLHRFIVMTQRRTCSRSCGRPVAQQDQVGHLAAGTKVVRNISSTAHSTS